MVMSYARASVSGKEFRSRNRYWSHGQGFQKLYTSMRRSINFCNYYIKSCNLHWSVSLKMYFSNRRLTIYFNGRTKAVSWRKHVRVLKQRCVFLIASNLLRNELSFCKLCFLKQRHEKISFIVYATISDFVRAMISLVL